MERIVEVFRGRIGAQLRTVFGQGQGGGEDRQRDEVRMTVAARKGRIAIEWSDFGSLNGSIYR